MRRFTTALLGAVIAIPLTLTACSPPAADPPLPPGNVDLDEYDASGGAGNGLWLLSSNDVTAEIVGAVQAAGSVSYSGSFTELSLATADVDAVPGRTITVDYSGRPGALSAAITAGSLKFEVVIVDGHSYIRGNSAYAEHAGVDKFADGFVCTSGGESLLDEWAPLLRPGDLVSALLTSSEVLDAMPPKEGSETLDVVIGTGEAPIGTMVVSGIGEPLPLTLVAGDESGNGSFAFSEWGSSAEVTPPSELAQPCS